VFLLPVSIDDIEAISQIETESFAQPWKRQAIIDELDCSDSCQYAAKVFVKSQPHAVVIAYIFVRLLIDEMHIMKIAVTPQWRNRGMGEALLSAIQVEGKRRGANTVLLEVRHSNIAAINLYQKTGFQTIGIRPNYYPQTGESALVMSKRLKEES
jgi:[ribosomal protein S18]-alanine N-acetyltransferase